MSLAVKQMGAQGGGPTEIMRNDRWSRKVPMGQHLGENYALHVKRGALGAAHVRLTIARHVIPMNGKARRKPGDDAMP